MFVLFSLDQLLVSAGDQQRLQSVLSSVRSKSTVVTLMQEAKAQSEVRCRKHGWNCCPSAPRPVHTQTQGALLQVSCCELTAQSFVSPVTDYTLSCTFRCQTGAAADLIPQRQLVTDLPTPPRIWSLSAESPQNRMRRLRTAGE